MREDFYYISNKKSRRERYGIRDDVVEHRGFGVCCGCALHTDGSPTEMQSISVPVSPLCAKNGSPNRFLYAQTLAGSNPYLIKNSTHQKACTVFWWSIGDSNP